MICRFVGSGASGVVGLRNLILVGDFEGPNGNWMKNCDPLE